MGGLDDLLRDAGVRLAGGQTRRGMLGHTAAVAALAGLGGALRTVDPEEALAARRTAPPQCLYGRRNINVCYEPWKIIASEPKEYLPRGFEGVAVRKGPELDAPIIYKLGDPCIIPVGRHFAAQSRRDGGVRLNCPSPGRRPSINGFAWGYAAADSGTHNKGGWIAEHVDGVRYAQRALDYKGLMCGPADLDFDCRAGDDPNSKYKKRCGLNARPGSDGYQCGGSRAFSGTCTNPTTMWIGVEREPDDYPLINDLSHERYNLKWEADGTTFFWLVPGDVVRRYCYKCTEYNPSKICPVQTYDPKKHDCCRAYSCVEVVRAQYAPTGSRGWINSSVLRTRPQHGARTAGEAVRTASFRYGAF